MGHGAGLTRAFLAAFDGAALVSLAAALVERSRLAFGGLAFYGNGALVVPLVGAALVIFGTWTWLLRGGAPRTRLLSAAAGTHFGIGLWSLFDFLLGTAGTTTNASPLAWLPGFAFQGLFFVVPAAIFAALATWAFLSNGLPMHPVVIAIAAIAGLPLGVAVPMLPAGLAAGVATAIAARARTTSAVAFTAVGLVAFLLALGIGVPLLMSGPGSGR